MSRQDLLFCEGDTGETLDAHFAKAVDWVNKIPEAQFLNTDDDAVVEHVVSEFAVQPLELYRDKAEMEQQETGIDVSSDPNRIITDRSQPFMVPGLKVTVSIPYAGDQILWKLRPNPYRMLFPRGTVQGPGEDGIGFLVIVMEAPSDVGPEVYKRDLDGTFENLAFFLEAQKAQVEAKNKELPGIVRRAVQSRRERLHKHAKVAQVLNIPLKKREGSPDIAKIPVPKRIVRSLPPAPNRPPEPGIGEEDYELILGVIRNEGKSYEATPRTFACLDEEDLRNIIVAHLNHYFPGQATAETFRVSGKTDIRIEDKNRAAFVAECKIWRGAKELSEAIEQLLGYLTWRDCKAALVVFNKEVAGFSELQKKVPEALRDHPNQVRPLKSDGDEWRFVLRSKDDPERHVTVHVFLFNLYAAG